jgi:hypothetical protein
MSCLQGIEFPGDPHHGTSLGDRREALYADDEDRAAWLRLLCVPALQLVGACLLPDGPPLSPPAGAHARRRPLGRDAVAHGTRWGMCSTAGSRRCWWRGVAVRKDVDHVCAGLGLPSLWESQQQIYLGDEAFRRTHAAQGSGTVGRPGRLGGDPACAAALRRQAAVAFRRDAAAGPVHARPGPGLCGRRLHAGPGVAQAFGVPDAMVSRAVEAAEVGACAPAPRGASIQAKMPAMHGLTRGVDPAVTERCNGGCADGRPTGAGCVHRRGRPPG